METTQLNKTEKLTAWMEQYGTELLRMCTLYLGDIQLAEDVVQETFLKAYMNMESFKERSSDRTWLTRIAINQCKDYKKSSWFKREDCTEFVEEIMNSQNISEEAYLQETGIVKEQESRELIGAVMSLPIKYRECILMCYYQELTVGETAAVLNVPESTVYTRLRRGKTMLKKKLEGWCLDEENNRFRIIRNKV